MSGAGRSGRGAGWAAGARQQQQPAANASASDGQHDGQAPDLEGKGAPEGQQQQQQSLSPQHQRQQRHGFFAQWLERNCARAFAEGTWSIRSELRSAGRPPYKRADNVLYLLGGAATRYVIVELDGREHADRGLVDDVFRINWFCNARFGRGVVHAVRLNPDQYERRDGMRASPGLKERLQRVMEVLSRVRADNTATVQHVRVHYLYYSYERLRAFQGMDGCQLSEVQQDVEYCLTFQRHADPGYLARPALPPAP